MDILKGNFYSITIKMHQVNILKTRGQFTLEDLRCSNLEILLRNGKGGCGAWSYDKEEGDCFIHNVDACCGQFGKQEKNPNFTSGYSCNICWSTKRDTDCPCSADDR